jgi:hypothetical protein
MLILKATVRVKHSVKVTMALICGIRHQCVGYYHRRHCINTSAFQILALNYQEVNTESKVTYMQQDKEKSKQPIERSKAGTKRPRKNTDEKEREGEQKIAAAGEVQYAQTIGRHGSEEETTLSPEE